MINWRNKNSQSWRRSGHRFSSHAPGPRDGQGNPSRHAPVQYVPLQIPELEAVARKWDSIEEEIKIEQDMKWIKSPNNSLPSLNSMMLWLQKGPKKLVIEDETQFCDENMLRNILHIKSTLYKIHDDIRHVRTRCNTFETIRNAFFLNRSAVKMANMDKACNFMFTKPAGLKNNELLYFADVCAGPGGFSEYVLWRKKWHAKGFGLTLKNIDDFELNKFQAGPCETFHPYYGPKGDGDIFDPSNQKAFRNLIMTHTHGKGVHFMMSDGAFEIEEGQESLQEIFLKQIYLCQCLVALMVVREGGHFVTNIFDLFTPFSAGLIYLMYLCFEEICILKPNSSRPANSERFLICKSKRPRVHDVIKYLEHVNNLLLQEKNNNDVDVLQLVSPEELENDKHFVEYLCASNNLIGRKQIIALRKLAAFYRNPSFVEPKQDFVRKECLKYWELPDHNRRTYIRTFIKPTNKLSLLGYDTKLTSVPAKRLTTENIQDTILNEPCDWFCVPCSTGISTEAMAGPTFYMGMGRNNVYYLVDGIWTEVDDINVELPPDTLVYAEIVQEITKEYQDQQQVLALHIIDAVILGGENIGHKCLKDRYELIKQFCEALWKPDGSRYARVRIKELLPIGPNIRETLQVKPCRINNRMEMVYEFQTASLDCNSFDNNKPYFVLRSVIFLKNNFCNSKVEENKSAPHRLIATKENFIQSFENRIIWYWSYDRNFMVENLAQLIKSHWP
ncbi:cap-specific mRNA (nucleoside-2'-O-)-methyltransferase 1-like [Megachile rotundata]|uniref:cap-specific mRNA (nucleoside-2'-O-)-methyltransferase 1-like n=1 Tax=Megachile rotundata TaxID=143995 RepID=UPI003FD20656